MLKGLALLLQIASIDATAPIPGPVEFWAVLCPDPQVGEKFEWGDERRVCKRWTKYYGRENRPPTQLACIKAGFQQMVMDPRNKGWIVKRYGCSKKTESI